MTGRAGQIDEATGDFLPAIQLEVPMQLPSFAFGTDALVVAAGAWSLAFAMYLWRFAPWLLTSRLDGKDG